MERDLAPAKRYTLDNLMNFNGIPVVEIADVHRIPRVLKGASCYVFRINDRAHLEEFHAPLFTTNVFVGNILPALVDPRTVATWSFPSEAAVPFYKRHLLEKLRRYEVAEPVRENAPGDGGASRYELALNRGRGLDKLDLVGYSLTARIRTTEPPGGFAGLCEQLAGPHWCKLERTVEYDELHV